MTSLELPASQSWPVRLYVETLPHARRVAVIVFVVFGLIGGI